MHCVFISLNRLIARDEGFYIVASELLLKGKILYKDFFFPQMPFTALFYALSFKIFGVSWFVARFSTGVIYFLSGCFLFIFIKKNYSYLFAILALMLFSLHPMGFAWQSVIKSYAFVNLFLMLIYSFTSSLANLKSDDIYNKGHSLLNSKISISNSKKIFFIGFIFGLLGLTRLHFLSLLPLVLFHIFSIQKKFSKKDFVSFFLGCTLSLSPCFYYMAQDINSFIFNNLGYHLVRSQTPLEGELTTKLYSLLRLLGLKPSQQIIKYQMIVTYFIPLCFGLYYFILKLFKKRFYFPFLYSLFILILNSIPTPTYLQYHSCIIIFIIIMSLDFIRVQNNTYLKFLISIVFLTVNISYYPKSLHAYTISAHNVIGITGQNPEMWSIHTVQKINEHLNMIDTDKYLVSVWPGHALNSKHKMLPGTENPFLIKVPEDIAKKYNFTKKDDILEAISNGSVGIVVYKDGDTINKKELKSFLIKNKFLLRSRLGNVFIWSRYEG